MASQPIEQFSKLPNFRALPRQLAPQLFRSGALSELTPAGQQELREYDIACVVDLREPYEIADAPDFISQYTYVNVPLYRGQVPLAAAIDDVYRLLLMERGHQMAAAVQAIAQSVGSRVVVHCKAGKDRTGLVVALMMAAAAVPVEIIVADYAQSADNLSPAYRRQITHQLETELAGNLAELKSAMQLHMASPGAALHGALELVDTKFGSVKQYLAAHGVNTEQLALLETHFGVGNDAS